MEKHIALSSLFIRVTFWLCVICLLCMTFLFFRWLSPINQHASEFMFDFDQGSLGAFLTAQANHYALIQVYLVAFSLAFAVAAFWGYNEIKNKVRERVDKQVNEMLPSLVDRSLTKLIPEQLNQMEIKLKMNTPSTGSTESEVSDFKKVVDNNDLKPLRDS